MNIIYDLCTISTKDDAVYDDSLDWPLKNAKVVILGPQATVTVPGGKDPKSGRKLREIRVDRLVNVAVSSRDRHTAPITITGQSSHLVEVVGMLPKDAQVTFVIERMQHMPVETVA